MALKRRVAVVGVGSIGRRHVRLLREHPDVTVEVVESSREALEVARRELGDLPSHDSFDAMLATAPDVVWIATPTVLHAEQSIAALEAGAHVFCEKPMSDTLASARAMRAAVDRSGRVFNVGFALHFAPAVLRLKQRIAEGALGNLLHLHARVGTYITLVNSGSRHQAAHPGSLFLDYSHQPDLFYWLTGKAPSSVQVVALQTGNLPLTSNPNVAAITYSYSGEMLATVHLNFVQMPQCHDYEIVGDEGWAQVSFPAGTVTLGRRSDQNISIETLAQAPDDLYRAQQQAFFEAIDGERPPSTSAADGLISTAICDASIESWRSRDCVAVAS